MLYKDIYIYHEEGLCPVHKISSWRFPRVHPRYPLRRDLIENAVQHEVARIKDDCRSGARAGCLDRRISGVTAIAHPKPLFADLPEIGNRVRIAHNRETIAIEERALRRPSRELAL